MPPGAQIDYDALASQHGGQAASPPAVDYDSLAASHGGTTSGDSSGGAGSPSMLDAFWDQTWGKSAIGLAGKGGDLISQWAASKVAQNRQENELAASQGKQPPHSETANALLGMLSSYGR